MLGKKNPYNSEIPEIEELQKMNEKAISKLLEEYLGSYHSNFVRSQQIPYFEAFTQGLLSKLERKSIEPIALSFLGETEVRGMQQFFTRSSGWYDNLRESYKVKLSETVNAPKGFLSVDESDFVKKGEDSAGVARQYCGRLGKRENCQAGVFLSYASEFGIGLVDSALYLPEKWFDDEHKEKREKSQIPSDMNFKTKNEIAKEMISKVIESRLFEIECIGCDASFGSDGTFLDSLECHYFAGVRKNEYIFRNMPQVTVPENSGKGGRFKHPRSVEEPVRIKTILDDDSIPWVKRVIAQGAKGPVVAEIKCLRCVESRKVNRLFVPKSEIWVYIRKHHDGTVKYFISNMPDTATLEDLDRLATSRWSVEQCFQECKSYLGMADYETRSYQAWHRHMLFVMIAHLFIVVLRHFLKKIRHSNNADDLFYHCFTDSHPNEVTIGFDDCSLSLAS